MKERRDKGEGVDALEFGRWRAHRLLWALAALAAVLVLAFVLVVGPWLFTRHPGSDLTAEQELKARNDVRTTLIQTVGGIALAGGLVVTYRTYRLNSSSAVTETYTKAVEQLGHEKAPVRLGAVHSLAQLGQDNPARRQTVIDVLCAYLRLPYAPDWDGDNFTGTEEDQVRQTAQRILATHLRTPSRIRREDAQTLKPSRQETFWPGISLDLTSANLVDVWFNDLSAVDAKFDRVTFFGEAYFERATFTGDTWFREAIFTNEARFHEATFTDTARFERTTFTESVAFVGATFTGNAWFDGTTFTGGALFFYATFTDSAGFSGTTFTDLAWFADATFTDSADFHGATFTGNAKFGEATFSGVASFDGATFNGDADFSAIVSQPGDPDLQTRRVWPSGWTVRTGPDTPDTGRLVRDDGEGTSAAPDSSV